MQVKKLSEEKFRERLLIKELCLRLPYGVRVEFNGDGFPHKVTRIDLVSKTIESTKCCAKIKDCKIYLRHPMDIRGDLFESYKNEPSVTYSEEWFLKNHIDIHDLMDYNLAIRATKENCPYDIQ